MVKLSINSEFRNLWPEVKLVCISCEVSMSEKDERLWEKIDELSAKIRSSRKIEDVSRLPAISSSRKAYKALGKDPARYRLSAEALMRRVIKGNSLYQINNVVDVVNLASVTSGFSIGGYDLDRIEGNITLGVGHTNEPYAAIGRGELNIESLPIMRDDKGAFGSPTSDSVRTCVTMETKRFLMVYFGFGAHDELNEAAGFGVSLLTEFAGAKNIERILIE